MKPLHIDRERLLRELDELASITDCPAAHDASLPEPQRAVTRIVFTARDMEARRWLRDRVQEAGFSWREDAVGNTFIGWQGRQPELAAIATGSHIDAIPFAGMYDGTVGVLGGLEAMRALAESGFIPERSIELILFTSEEPTRFGLGCLGSRLLSGELTPDRADALVDRLAETDGEASHGTTLAEARDSAGFAGPLHTVELQANHYAGFVELHIEQGPLLERDEVDLGVVTHIAGPASYRLTVEGLGGHAGALLMPDRRDALCAAAEIVLTVERLVREANQRAGRQEVVGTVGKLDVHPGAVNAVPSRVQLMLDLRSINAASRTATVHSLRTAIAELERSRNVRVTVETLNEDEPVVCDPALVGALEEAAQQAGANMQRMVSRAYHDTSFMALKVPAAMLFVPCRNGVSHRPDEYATPEALVLGTLVLARTLARLTAAGA